MLVLTATDIIKYLTDVIKYLPTKKNNSAVNKTSLNVIQISFRSTNMITKIAVYENC